jgi:ABC-type protease/lipase transport system fused ATPase/permease subunit
LEAARVAGAHELILRLPNGYSTRIGEGGTLLSAGQRQRIGLARAIFGNPFLIVLDEPNANLDADGENALSKAIETLRRGKRIVIVVSHRPSAVAALNMAMVLNQGSVIAFGPREEAFAQVTRAAVGQAPFGLVKPGPALVAGGARP